MTPRTFTALAVAAVVSLALAALVNASSDSWTSGEPQGAKLLANFGNSVARVKSLTIRQGEKSLVLDRKSDTEWVARSQGGYPVQTEKVRALLVKLLDAQLVSAKTRMPDRFKLLDLDDVAKGSNSRLLSLVDDKGAKLAEVLIGKRSVEQFGAGKGGTYVRRAGQNETWLINAEIDVSADVNQWVDTLIAETDVKKVLQVTIDQPGKPQVRIDRESGKPADKDGYQLAGMPAGKALKTDFALEDVVNAFARLEFEDVRKKPAGDQPAPAAKPAAGAKTAAASDVSTAVFESEDGLLMTIAVRKEGDVRWARVTAEGTGEAETAAEKINARANAWEYKLPSWKFEQMFKPRDDLLKDAQPAAAGKGNNGPK